MTNEIDWDNAPEGAEFFAAKTFYKRSIGRFLFWHHGEWLNSDRRHSDMILLEDYQERPQQKPSDKHPTTSTEYLIACAQVQSERANQYDASGTGERSFEATAEAFNCVTGKNLRGSDVCLILAMVKFVRQYSDPTRLHKDSVLDAVSYLSLWAEELTKELR